MEESYQQVKNQNLKVDVSYALEIVREKNIGVQAAQWNSVFNKNCFKHFHNVASFWRLYLFLNKYIIVEFIYIYISCVSLVYLRNLKITEEVSFYIILNNSNPKQNN